MRPFGWMSIDTFGPQPFSSSSLGYGHHFPSVPLQNANLPNWPYSYLKSGAVAP